MYTITRFSAFIRNVAILLIVLILLPAIALAHTKLEQSTPKEGAVVEKVSNIELTFNTKLERTSTFQVFDQENKPVKVKDIRIEQDTLRGTVDQPLSNGVYTIRWKIIGADGHPITGTVSFQVKNKEEKAQPSTMPTNNGGLGASPDAGNTNNQTDRANETAPQPAAESKQENPSSWVLPFSIGVLLAAVNILFWLVRQRRR